MTPIVVAWIVAGIAGLLALIFGILWIREISRTTPQRVLEMANAGKG